MARTAAYWGPGSATLAEVDLTDDSENYLFVGAVPTLLLLWFGLAGHRAWQPGRRLMAFTLMVSCLFMLGRYTPFYSLAFRVIPGIDLFRRPTDASFVFVIALAFIVGHCLADYIRDGLPRLRPLGALLTLSASVAIVGSAVGIFGQDWTRPERRARSRRFSWRWPCRRPDCFLPCNTNALGSPRRPPSLLPLWPNCCGGIRHRV